MSGEKHPLCLPPCVGYFSESDTVLWVIFVKSEYTLMCIELHCFRKGGGFQRTPMTSYQLFFINSQCPFLLVACFLKLIQKLSYLSNFFRIFIQPVFTILPSQLSWVALLIIKQRVTVTSLNNKYKCLHRISKFWWDELLSIRSWLATWWCLGKEMSKTHTPFPHIAWKFIIYLSSCSLRFTSLISKWNIFWHCAVIQSLGHFYPAEFYLGRRGQWNLDEACGIAFTEVCFLLRYCRDVSEGKVRHLS